ncbi:MAG: class II aldolase/adducin family protein [Deltaproteobacteria bacterium]|nr:class II aldolase/adducin family protein [Deltaproteobacteria bacterium]
MASTRKDLPAIDSAELREQTEKLITACHILDREGSTDGYGHVSVRVPGADAFITIANVSPGCVTRDRLGLFTRAFSRSGPMSRAFPTRTQSGARSSACFRTSSSRCTTTASSSPPTARQSMRALDWCGRWSVATIWPKRWATARRS